MAVSILDFRARRPKITEDERAELYDLYLRRHDRIDTWDLVDRAAPRVVGWYLLDKTRDPCTGWRHLRTSGSAALPSRRRSGSSAPATSTMR